VLSDIILSGPFLVLILWVSWNMY